MTSDAEDCLLQRVALAPLTSAHLEMQVASSDLFAIRVGGLGRRVLGARITIHP